MFPEDKMPSLFSEDEMRSLFQEDKMPSLFSEDKMRSLFSEDKIRSLFEDTTRSLFPGGITSSFNNGSGIQDFRNSTIIGSVKVINSHYERLEVYDLIEEVRQRVSEAPLDREAFNYIMFVVRHITSKKYFDVIPRETMQNLQNLRNRFEVYNMLVEVGQRFSEALFDPETFNYLVFLVRYISSTKYYDIISSETMKNLQNLQKRFEVYNMLVEVRQRYSEALFDPETFNYLVFVVRYISSTKYCDIISSETMQNLQNLQKRFEVYNMLVEVRQQFSEAPHDRETFNYIVFVVRHIASKNYFDVIPKERMQRVLKQLQNLQKQLEVNNLEKEVRQRFSEALLDRETFIYLVFVIRHIASENYSDVIPSERMEILMEYLQHIRKQLEVYNLEEEVLQRLSEAPLDPETFNYLVIVVRHISSEKYSGITSSETIKELQDQQKLLQQYHHLHSRTTIAMGIIGPGSVGSTLLDQIRDRAAILKEERNIDLRVMGIMGSKLMLLDDDDNKGINLDKWRTLGEEKGEVANLEKFVTNLEKFVQNVRGNDFIPNTVLVDCTADSVIARNYHDWLSKGIYVITANKKANSGPLKEYLKLRALQRQSYTRYFYEATVGAGLPIISTLRGLLETGDRILQIEGTALVFSGTLSYIFNNFKDGRLFSEVVAEARDAGYTEPDPRDDLSGTDVARKVIILARESGLELGLSDITVKNLVPELIRVSASAQEFMQQLPKFDQELAEKLKHAESAEEVLRYVGVVDVRNNKGVVELRRYKKDHPFAQVSGSDNMIAFTTRIYKTQPLIIRGPGAGAQFAAGGIFRDILRLASYLGAPS